MNLRHRLNLTLIVGLILCLAWLGWEFLRPDDPPANSDKVATIAETPEPAAPPALAQPAPAVTPAPHVSSASGTFRGRVIDAVTRQPVREFELEFQPFEGTVRSGEQMPARTFRTKDGRFEWPGIRPRVWTVTAKARGYQRFDIDQLLISAGSDLEAVLPLQRGNILRGRVYDETSGAGIAAAVVSFREAHVERFAASFHMRPRATTSKDGSFVLDGVPAGSIILSVSASQYASREIDVSSGAETSPIQIALSAGGTIAGYLAAADGVTPIAGAIAIDFLDGDFGMAGSTGDAGEFKYDHLPPGRYRIVGSRAGQQVERELALAKGERKEGLVLALGGGGRSIRGTITGLRPAELERVRVSVNREGGIVGMGEVPVDARGAYEIQGVAPGEVRVSADINLARQVAETVQMPADADLTVNLDFPRGVRLMGNITRGGRPLSNVWVRPLPLTGPEVFLYGARSSEKGEYVIEDVPNGEYFIQLDSYRSRNFKVSGDTVMDIDVPVAEFSGRIFEEAGKVPLVGVDVEIWSAHADSTRVWRNELSNHFGDFTFAGLEPGDYMLSAYKPGYEMYRERVSFSSALDEVTIRLRHSKGVEIRMHDASSGMPLRNVQVYESIGGRRGSALSLHLDENGVGFIPSALAGSKLSFTVFSYVPAIVENWSGEALDLQLEKQAAR